MMRTSFEIKELCAKVLSRMDLSLRGMRELSDLVAGRTAVKLGPSRCDRVIRRIFGHPVSFTLHNVRVADAILAADESGISKKELMALLGWTPTGVNAAVVAIRRNLDNWREHKPIPVDLVCRKGARYAFVPRKVDR